MSDLINLSIDLQIMLFAGYVAHLVDDIGRWAKRGAEEVIFRVFGFGVVLVAGWSALKATVVAVWPEAITWVTSGFQDAVKVALFVAAAVFLGAAWRKLLRPRMSWLMSSTGVYQDDHQPSIWASVLTKDKGWNYVKIRTVDGVSHICEMHQLPEKLPVGMITINNDGLAMYVTKRQAPGSDAKCLKAVYGEKGASRITVFPIASIQQVEIGWDSNQSSSGGGVPS